MSLRVALVLACAVSVRGLHIADDSHIADDAHPHHRGGAGHSHGGARDHHVSADQLAEWHKKVEEKKHKSESHEDIMAKSNAMVEDLDKVEKELKEVADMKAAPMTMKELEASDQALLDMSPTASSSKRSSGKASAAGGKVDKSAKKSVMEELKIQQEQCRTIMKRKDAAEEIYNEAKEKADSKKADSKETKKKAEKAFCDTETTLRKAVTLHQTAKKKQIAAIAKVQLAVNATKGVAKAFSKSRSKAKKYKSSTLKQAIKVYQEFKKAAQSGKPAKTSPSERDEIYKKAKVAEELVEEVENTETNMIDKLSAVFRKPACNEMDAMKSSDGSAVNSRGRMENIEDPNGGQTTGISGQ